MAHLFEQAGLGKAPFKLVGHRENWFKAGNDVKPGGTCDYCSTGIAYEYVIESADRVRSVVGCDCILKLEWVSNSTLIKQVDQIRKEGARKRREAKLAEQIRQATEVLADPVISSFLSSQPHPKLSGKSLLDYCQWLLRNAGVNGRQQAARIVKRAADQVADQVADQSGTVAQVS